MTVATTGLGYFQAAATAPLHTLLTLTGGSIGIGPACAAGAAIACPDRAVSTSRATGARCTPCSRSGRRPASSCAYHPDLREPRLSHPAGGSRARRGFGAGKRALSLTELSPPPLDWVRLASGMGVPLRASIPRIRCARR